MILGMSRDRTCTFFGHQIVDGDILDALYDAVRKVIEEYGVTTFWCGDKGEFDRLAASTVFKFKREHPDIEIVYVRAYLPTDGEKLSEFYDTSIYPEGLETVPRRFAISRRNLWMAKNCDIAITYINRDYGGAYQAYRTAKNKRKIVMNLGEL